MIGRHGVAVERVAAIAKKLEEDDESGEQRYTYLRSGPDHYSMAFTYNVIAWERDYVPVVQWIEWESPWRILRRW